MKMPVACKAVSINARAKIKTCSRSRKCPQRPFDALITMVFDISFHKPIVVFLSGFAKSSPPSAFLHFLLFKSLREQTGFQRGRTKKMAESRLIVVKVRKIRY